MKRIALGLSALSLMLLAACGGQSLTAQQVLDNMHKHFVDNVAKQTAKFQPPMLSQTVTDLALETKPIAALFPGSINMQMHLQQDADVTDAKKVKFQAGMKLNLAASAPAEMFGMAGSAMQQASLMMEGSVRSVNNKVFANISSLSVQRPGKSAATMDKKVADTWYMSTFDEINKMMGEGMQDDPEAIPFSVENLLEKSVAQYRDSGKQLQALVEKAHIWNAVELMPDKDGLYAVRVEADKQKLGDTMEALMDYILQQNDPAGTNAAMQKEMADAKKDMRADMQKMGGLKGILYANKDSFDPRGFQGQITDSGGTVQLDIDIYFLNDGNGHAKLSNPAKPTENVTFDKKGEDYTLMVNGKKVAEGKMSPVKFTLTAYEQPDEMMGGPEDPMGGAAMSAPAAQPTTVLTADLDIMKSSDEAASIKGKVTIPGAGSEIDIDKLDVTFANAHKDMNLDMALRATLLGSPALDLTLKSSRKEASSVTVEEPSVAKPFADMAKDFGPLLSTLQE